MKKDELVKDLENILQRYQHGAEENGWCLPESFGSDMIGLLEAVLSRETAMLEEIEKPLSLSVMFQESFDDSLGLTEARKALAIIQRRRGGE